MQVHSILKILFSFAIDSPRDGIPSAANEGTSTQARERSAQTSPGTQSGPQRDDEGNYVALVIDGNEVRYEDVTIVREGNTIRVKENKDTVRTIDRRGFTYPRF